MPEHKNAAEPTVGLGGSKSPLFIGELINPNAEENNQLFL